MSLRKQLKQAWDALAYADVGEFLPYAEKCRVLGLEPPKGSRGLLPPMERHSQRQVALGLVRGFDLAQASYAIETAQRLQADLVVLQASPEEQALAQIASLCDEAQVRLTRQVLGTPWIDAVARFLRNQPSVVCLVLGQDSLDADGLKTPAKRAFATPVVIVGGEAGLVPAF